MTNFAGNLNFSSTVCEVVNLLQEVHNTVFDWELSQIGFDNGKGTVAKIVANKSVNDRKIKQ